MDKNQAPDLLLVIPCALCMQRLDVPIGKGKEGILTKDFLMGAPVGSGFFLPQAPEGWLKEHRPGYVLICKACAFPKLGEPLVATEKPALALFCVECLARCHVPVDERVSADLLVDRLVDSSWVLSAVSDPARQPISLGPLCLPCRNIQYGSVAQSVARGQA